MKSHVGGLILALGLAVASAGCGAPLPDGSAARAFATLHARSGAVLNVVSSSFQAGGDIPLNDSQYGANRFPGLSWSGAPPGARAYVLILQDVNAPRRGPPLVHCVVIDIPAGVTHLPAGMTDPPAPARYGLNYLDDKPPYAGPRPPPGPKHHYHFQVFALDAPLVLPANTDYDALIAAMKGHVLASGELVGLGGAPS